MRVIGKIGALLATVFSVSCGGGSSSSVSGIDTTPSRLPAPKLKSSDGGRVMEKRLAGLLRAHPKQRRKRLVFDSRLHRVARAKARDMAKRRYFSHVDPDGNGPNYHVKRTGYSLPKSWTRSRRLNYVESILSGPKTAKEAVYAFINSRPHQAHILGRDSFYAGNTFYGVGHFYDPQSVYKHYWVFISAPPPGSKK